MAPIIESNRQLLLSKNRSSHNRNWIESWGTLVGTPLVPTIICCPGTDVLRITVPGARRGGVLSPPIRPVLCHNPSLEIKRVTCARHHLWLDALISLLVSPCIVQGQCVKRNYMQINCKNKTRHAIKTSQSKCKSNTTCNPQKLTLSHLHWAGRMVNWLANNHPFKHFLLSNAGKVRCEGENSNVAG